jgi:hypothetical protein
MAVGRRLPLERVKSGFGAPDLRPPEEHPLVAGKAVDNWA